MTKLAADQNDHDEEEKGECGVNPRPNQAVLAVGVKAKLSNSVHVFVLPSIRRES